MSRTASQIGKLSRRKGKSFECWCARYFTQWTGLEWQTTRNSGRTDLKGDIYCLSRPDLPLIVECKHRKEYSVHAMLKPTKAFADMVHSIINKGLFVIIIVKNETGVWFRCSSWGYVESADAIVSSGSGIWTRLQHIRHTFEVNGVTFDASKMESVGKTGKG